MSLKTMLENFVSPKISCEPGVPVSLVRNIAARGLPRTFTLKADGVSGLILVRRSYLPFFWLGSEETLQFVSGMTVQRSFFDASFEILMTANAPCVVEVL